MIFVSAAVHYADGSGDKTRVAAAGSMENDGALWRICYAEPEDGGMAGTETVLSVSPQRMELTRTGAVRLHLVFVPGETYASVYETPYGTFDAVAHTQALRVRMDAHGGLIDLRYTLTIAGAPDAHHLKIQVKSEEEP